MQSKSCLESVADPTPAIQDIGRLRHENKIKKMKFMRIGSGKERTVKISIAGKVWEQVGKLCCLERMTSSDAKCHVERCRNKGENSDWGRCLFIKERIR